MFARRLVALTAALGLLLSLLFTPWPAAAAPLLTLPFTPGETWTIAQGYNCGSHRDNEDALDLVRAEGSTRNVPIMAAAPGRVTYAGGSTNTVTIDHGGGYSTVYIHLASRAVGRGQVVERGQVVGTAGDTGARGSGPHLHFELIAGRMASDRARNTLPLSFADGYELPNTGRCNQYVGTPLTASGAAPDAPGSTPSQDTTPPSLPTLLDGGQGQFRIVRWNASADAGSGVKGYQLYVGTEPRGVGEWFVAETEVALPALEPGRNFVRIRALDTAGNASDWTTLLEVDG